MMRTTTRASTSTHSGESVGLRKRGQPHSSQNEDDVKRKKLQCSLLEMKLYKHRLECLKLEKELLLPSSTFTYELFD